MTVRRVVVDHVGVVVRDLAASRRFYAAALAPLGFGVVAGEGDGVAFGVAGTDDFGLNRAQPGETPSARAHVAFVAEDAAAVDAFHAAALAAGGREKGAPSLHAEYHVGYYAAFVWDPDDNNIEAVFHGPRD